jgi:hypothetical protein
MQVVKNISADETLKNHYLKEIRVFEIALQYALPYRRAYFKREIARFKYIINNL